MEKCSRVPRVTDGNGAVDVDFEAGEVWVADPESVLLLAVAVGARESDVVVESNVVVEPDVVVGPDVVVESELGVMEPVVEPEPVVESALAPRVPNVKL